MSRTPETLFQMRQNDATTATDGATLTRQGATIGDAAKALNVSVRTVQRRIERGELSVIERDGRRLVLLPTGTPTDATEGGTVTRQTATSDATPRQIDATGRGDVEAELRAQLAREREFSAILKSQLEAVTQSEAMTKAALREALRAMPKQLTAGDASAMPQPTPTAPPGAQESGAAVNDGVVNVESSTRAPDARESGGYDYGAICDRLESDLLKKRQT